MTIELPGMIDLLVRSGAVVLSLVTMWWLLHRSGDARLHARCGGCRYELNALGDGRCPECGGDLLVVGVRGHRGGMRPRVRLALAMATWIVIYVAQLPWLWTALDAAVSHAIAPTTIRVKADRQTTFSVQGTPARLRITKQELLSPGAKVLDAWLMLEMVDRDDVPLERFRAPLPSDDAAETERTAALAIGALGVPAGDASDLATKDLMYWLNKIDAGGPLMLIRQRQSSRTPPPTAIVTLYSSQANPTSRASSPPVYLSWNATALAINVRLAFLVAALVIGLGVVWMLWRRTTERG